MRSRILSTALITAGLVVLADAGLTLIWQEPVSAVYGSVQQGRAEDDLAELEDSFPSAADLAAIEGVSGNAAQARILARRFAKRIKVRDAIGRIAVPRMELDAVLLHGTDTGTLQHGPGHYEDTPMPGLGGTSAIAGHRTTYLAPFNDIDNMERGDEVRVELPYAVFTYRVEKTDIVEPGDVEVIKKVDHERLVMTACHPLHSAAQRFVVFARLVRIDTFAIGGTGAWVTP